MDKEQIKKALDSFEDDKFSDAKDILKKEIQDKRDEFLIDKLGLEKEEENASVDTKTETEEEETE